MSRFEQRVLPHKKVALRKPLAKMILQKCLGELGLTQMISLEKSTDPFGFRRGEGIFSSIACLLLIAANVLFKQVVFAEGSSQLSGPVCTLPAHAGAKPSLNTEIQKNASSRPKKANFGLEAKSVSVRKFADWVVNSGNNDKMIFTIVDKVNAKVYVFDCHGRLRGAAPALLGLARGDFSNPEIAKRRISQIRTEERITPAGRFVACLAVNSFKEDILWVDYNNAVALHRVITKNPHERRLERLASPNPQDNRISYGCINVPMNFFNDVVKPSFKDTKGIVYVLPEIQPMKEIFKSYYDFR